MVLSIEVMVEEVFNEETEEFQSKTITVDLEHSLISLSKWESEFEKPFLTDSEKSVDETIRYIECMVLQEDLPEGVMNKLSEQNLAAIQEYIQAKRSATFFSEEEKRPSRRSEIITSELIYYWMVALGIPMECENWHLNRLLTLVRICNVKNQPKEKVDKTKAAARRRALNQQRRAKYKTPG